MNNFTPLKVPKTFRQLNFGTFDIETKRDEKTGGANAKNFLYGCVYDGTKYYQFADREEMFSFMCSRKYRGYVWYAHNAEYDLSGLTNNIIEDFDNKLFAGSRLIQAKKYVNSHTDKNGKKHHDTITFLDSMNYFQTSLEKIGEAVGYNKIEMGFSNTERCEAIEKQDFKAITYNKRDCKVLYIALEKFFVFLHEFGINPRITIASNSMAIFRTKYLSQTYFIDDKDAFFRNSFYGGRTEVFNKNITAGRCYDVNSLYSYSMTDTRFPNPSKLKKQSGLKQFNKIIKNPDYEGCANITVRVPSGMNIPILPYRQDHKNIFPSGEFRGWYNFNEIRFAIERGYLVINCEDIIYSKGIDSPFKDYVKDIYEKRIEYKKTGNSFQMFCKYLLNSLYGKFGESHEVKELKKWDDKPEGDNWVFDKLGNSDWGYWKQINDDGVCESKITKHTIYSWASYVTSQSRIILYEYMEKAGMDISYCDTDSIFTSKIIPEDKKLGGVKIEYEFTGASFYRPKWYTVTSCNIEGDGFVMINPDVNKLKGVPHPALINDKVQAFNRVVKTKEALRRGLVAGTSITVIKHLNAEDDKRVWNKDGSSTPIVLSIDQ